MNESDAVDQVNQIFASIDLNMHDIVESARARKAKELHKIIYSANRAPLS
jgi:hypothetical protein